MIKAMKLLAAMFFAVIAVSAYAAPFVSAEKKEFVFCDEIKDMSVDETACQARNVYKPIPSKAKDNVHYRQKKVLDQDSYNFWKTIEDPTLSPDGKWAAYTLRNGSGVAFLVVRSTQDSIEFSLPRGTITEPERYDRIHSAQFTADSKAVVFTILPTKAGASEHGSRKATLSILQLPNGLVTNIANVLSWKLPMTSGDHLGYMVSKDEGDVSDSQDKADNRGQTLVIHRISSSSEVRISDVTEFSFADAGTTIVYAISSANLEANGVYVRRLTGSAPAFPLSGPGRYRGLVVDLQGQQISFLGTDLEGEREHPQYSLYYSRSSEARAVPVVSAQQLATDLRISPDSSVEFTTSGKALIFSVQSKPTDLAAVENGPDFELWTWRELQPLPRGSRMKARSFFAIYHIASERYIQLMRSPVASSQVHITDDARYAILEDTSPYEFDNWKEAGNAADVYVHDLLTGKAQLLRKKWRPSWLFNRERTGSHLRISKVGLSPSGRYLIYFENQRWFSYDIEKETTVDLTGSLLSRTNFEQSPIITKIVAGWTSGDRRVLLYDEHDIWQVDPSGTDAPYNVTHGLGRDQNMIFRFWDDAALLYMQSNYTRDLLPSSASFTDSSRPLVLAAYDRNSRTSSIWKVSVAERTAPKRLQEVNERIIPIANASSVPQYLFKMETFTVFPDLWTTSRFDHLTKLSDANPQQREYRWGTEEEIEIVSSNGITIKGALYKPAGFDSSKKYPMIVGFYPGVPYEIPTGHYWAPVPLRGAYTKYDSPARFVSKGYVVFHPEVAAGPSYDSGPDVLRNVVPAVEAVIELGFVDPMRVALSGHSFSGFHTAYIVTQTNLFRCAVIGAGIFNPVSHYGANTSTGKPWFYESTLGGMNLGASIWENPQTYALNSPLLLADRIATPLLLLHNDGDSNVPFSQAIEFLTALRRNAKEGYLFNYKGEGHSLYKKHENELDWDARVHEFIDYHLMDAPRPEWMSHE